MKNLYKINITIFNDFGELVDTQLAFTTLDEMSNKLSEPETMYKLVEQARDFATAENMLIEELEDNQIDEFEVSHGVDIDPVIAGIEHSKANIEWLKDVVKECREISGQWNGDEPGYLEERAQTADEIAEKCHEIIELINYLDEN